MAEIRIEQEIYGRNQRAADANRARFGQAGLLVVNLLSSPGSGKTSLLERTAELWQRPGEILVIEGDVETQRDAERVRAAGVQALQIETHGGCHLSADEVGEMFDRAELSGVRLLLIENVGNLICPCGFDLGEDIRAVVASTTEGDDKPVKYPEAYHGADVCVLNKIDLLPYVSFDVERFEAGARRANEPLQFIRTSCTTGEGIDVWCDFLRQRMTKPE